MSELQRVFNYEGRQVRTVTVNGEPNFVANDVCEILGFANSSETLKRLEGDEVNSTEVTDSLGRTQVTNVVTESGLYSLVLGSRKLEAKQFKRWITHEVLPMIRKTGMYATDQLLDNPDFAIEVFQKLKEERQARRTLEIQSAQQQQIIHELQPKATYYDLVLQNKSLLPITKIAKDYGMSGQAMNHLLHDIGIQYKMGDTWLLYQKYADKGYTQSKTHLIDADNGKMYTNWTQKGRLFIYDLLKRERNILPLIEREKSA